MRRQHGFTLIEMMVVVSIVGVLAAFGVPEYRAYVLDARLDGAKAMLKQIEAQMRMTYLEKGQYCCEGDQRDENDIAAELGVPVHESGDFCYMITCRDEDLCPTIAHNPYIAQAEAEDAPIHFEIWAVLRNQSTGDVTAPGRICRISSEKRPPTGWVEPSSSSRAGREQQVVVLRYPAPVNGLDRVKGKTSHYYSWDMGISKTHALSP